jgi:hypothetical protein
LDLQLALSGGRFSAIEATLQGIDARTAEATNLEDQKHIFSAIGALHGGFDGLNKRLRRAQQEWLCSTSMEVVHRTNPYRPPLDAKHMRLLEAGLAEGRCNGDESCNDGWCGFDRTILKYGVPSPNLTRFGRQDAARTRTLEHYPRLPECILLCMFALGCGWLRLLIHLLNGDAWCWACVVVISMSLMLGLWDLCTIKFYKMGAAAGAYWVIMGDGTPLTVVVGLAAPYLMVLWGMEATLLQDDQKRRQLRRPPLLGEALTRRRDSVSAGVMLLGLVIWALYVESGTPNTLDEHEASAADGVFCISAFVGVFLRFWDFGSSWSVWVLQHSVFLLAVLFPLGYSFYWILFGSSVSAALDRASLQFKVARLQRSFGEVQKAAEIFGAAHAELHRSIGMSDARRSWFAAGAYARALCDAGRPQQAQALRDAFEAVAHEELEQTWNPWRRWTLAFNGLLSLIEASCALENGSRDTIALGSEVVRGEWLNHHFSEWRKLAPWVRAGLAVAVRRPDCEVLDALMRAVAAGCDVPVGVDIATGGWLALPEWEEFLGRMAEGAGGERWDDYRSLTITRFCRNHAAKLGHQHCFRHPAWKYSQWLRAEATASQELFALFDEDCDGRLSKIEYASYLHGIGLWTKCEDVLVKGEWRGYTAKAWDRQWAEDCNRLKANQAAGLDFAQFETLYKVGGDRCSAQLDLAQCKASGSSGVRAAY